EVDWAPSGVPADRLDEAKGLLGYYSSPGMIVYYFRVNCRKPPFDDPRVRRALGLAINRSVICEQILRGQQVPATTFVPPGLPAYRSPESRLGLDAEAARKLLAEAGFEGGRGFPEFSLLYNTDESHRKIAQYVALEWRRLLGIK